MTWPASCRGESRMDECVFCEIVAGTVPTSLVYADDKVRAFLDHRPVTPGHLLIIPNEHFVLLADLPDGLAEHMLRVGMRLAAAIRSSGMPCEGINLFVADGEAAGQEVFHHHLHVIPRWARDGFAITATAWSLPQPTRHDLDGNAALIRAALNGGARA
jgi:histidine triad (HIT) family protein